MVNQEWMRHGDGVDVHDRAVVICAGLAESRAVLSFPGPDG